MSFALQLRQAVEASPRVELHKVQDAVWKTWGAGGLSDDEAQALSDLIEARKAVPATQNPLQRRVGSRPRSPASMERRRSWAACGHLPPQIAARFTMGEAAVLAVIGAEVRTKGACTLTKGHLAALAGVSGSTVKNALRAAVAAGVIRVEERRVSAFRNLPNRTTIVDGAWHAWLRLRRAGVGLNLCPPRIQTTKTGAASRPQRAAEKERRTDVAPRRGGSSPAFFLASRSWRA
jgi:hypothetical protein